MPRGSMAGGGVTIGSECPHERLEPRAISAITYESAAAHASRTRSGKGLSAPYGRRDSGVGGTGSHARPSAAFECYAGSGGLAALGADRQLATFSLRTGFGGNLTTSRPSAAWCRRKSATIKLGSKLNAFACSRRIR